MLKALFRLLFGGPTIDEAMFAFDQAIKKLEQVEHYEAAQRDKATEKIAREREKQEAANRKAATARAQRDRIQSVFYGSEPETAAQ